MDPRKQQEIFVLGSQVENKSRICTTSIRESRYKPSSQTWLHANSPVPMPPPSTPLPYAGISPVPPFGNPLPPSVTPCQPPSTPNQLVSSAYDQDYEDISTILHRLKDSEHQFLLPSVSISCKCPDVEHVPSQANKSHHSKKSEAILLSSSEDESGSDSDEESFKLAQLFRAFSLYEKKSHEKKGGSLGALRNLVSSYHSREDIGDEETTQVLELLEHENPGLQEMAILTMKQLCVRENNAFKFLFHDTVPKLLLLLELETTASLHEPTAFALEQILSHVPLKEWWLDQMKMGGFASVLNHLSPDFPLPVRYACGCVLKSLAQVQLFASLIVQQAIPSIDPFKTMNSDFQELYTEIISKLLLSADAPTTSLLSVDALPASVNMLQQGPCGPQQQSLHLIGALTDTPTGMKAITEGKVIPLIVSALVNTDCRKVREKAAKTLCTLSSKSDPEIQRDFLLHVDEFYHHQEDQLDQVIAEQRGGVTSKVGGAIDKGGGVSGKGSGEKTGLTKKEKMERAMESFGKDLVRLLQKEGRMEKDLHGDIVDVHLAPGIDVNATTLNCICHLLEIMSNMVNFSVCQVKVSLADLKEQFPQEVKEVRSKCLPVNHRALQILIKTKALTIVDLLSVYTQKLLDVISNQNKKNISVSTNQILFQAWDSQSAVMSKAGTVYLRGIFHELETNLVTRLLETLATMSECSAHCRSNLDTEEDTLETRVQDKIDRRKDVGESSSMKQDSKVSKKSKTKKQLFHSKSHCQLCNKKGVSFSQGQAKSENSGKTQAGRSRSPVKDTCSCSESNVNLEKVEKCYKEGMRKELGMICRDIRIALFEAGLIESVGPWLLSADPKQQELVLAIINNMIQPLDEKIVPRSPKDVKTKFDLTKPASQMCQKEREHAMSVALYQMSSRMRSFIEDALSKSTEPNDSTLAPPPPAAVTVVKQNYDKFARSATSGFDSRPPSGKSSDRARSPRRKSGCTRTGTRPHSAVAIKSALNRPSSASRTTKGDSRDKRTDKRPSTAKDRALSQPRQGNMTEGGLNKAGSVPGFSSVEGKAQKDEQLYSASLGYVGIDSGISSSGSRSRSSLGGHRCRSPLNKRPQTPLRSGSDVGRVQDAFITPGQKAFRRMWVPWKPRLDFTQPLGEQCRCLVALVVGKVLLQKLFAKGSDNRKKALNFIDQYIQHGQVGSHLKMSELGIIPKMVDFLRVNDDNQILEMMGLSVVQSLIKSDDRLKELFQRHGGTQLLMAMTSCSTGALKEEVTDTLKVISKSSPGSPKAVKKSKRPASKQPQRPGDIWDEIMQRWKQEDKVTSVLQNFAQG